MIHRYVLTIFLLGWSLTGFAQPGKLFSADQELSNSLVRDIHQDHNRIIWIATEDGLNRYDGAKFTLYKHRIGDTTSLSHNQVHMLFEDSRGNFFIGFYNGLQQYDCATDTFRRVPLLLEGGADYKAHVTAMLERRNGEVLIATSGHGIFSLKQEQDRWVGRQLRLPVGSMLIRDLFEDQAQNLWVATQDNGLTCLRPNGHVDTYFRQQEHLRHTLSSICQDRAGTVYAGTLNGLYAYAPDADQFRPVAAPTNTRLPINTLYLGREGHLYLGTEGEGLKVYDVGQQKISDEAFHVSTFDFTKTKVSTVLEDQAGNLWIGIYQKGVMLLPAMTNNFRYIGYKSVSRNLIGSSNVMSVYKDHAGTLWVGTDGDGLYGIAPDGKVKAHFAPSSQAHAVPATIMCIFEDSDRTLWLGSYQNGLAKLNRETGVCTYVNDRLSHALQPPRIFHLVEDARKNLWIGTMGAGLFCMNLTTEKVTQYEAVSGEQYRPETNVLHNSWINTLLLTPDEKLYIGTFDGFGCLDLATQSFTSTYGTNRLLSGHIVYAFHEDAQGTIWMGTEEGLAYIDRDTHQLSVYTQDDGLPSDVIKSLVGDPAGNLWMGTNHGISKFSLRERQFINYYAQDGVQGNEFSLGAAFMGPEGQLVFGGLNGITYFYPDEIIDQAKELHVRIAGFYLHDQPIHKGSRSGNREIINTSVMNAETFHLSHKDNAFTLEFSALEFYNPERITYLYAMDDGDWVALRPGTDNVTFTNLAPGTYRFRVKAKDYTTYSAPKEIQIVIAPPWYFSTWANVGYGALLFLIALLVVQQVRQRQRTRQKMREHLHAKQINEAKLQFFINIAHEIRTPMSLIISPLKKLMTADDDRERRQDYDTMHRNSERILRLINQLMDVRKIDKGQMQLRFQEREMVQYLRDICALFEEQAQSHHLRFTFLPAVEEVPVWVDPDHFDKVMINVLANAFKFTPERGTVAVALSTGEDTQPGTGFRRYVEIVVSDSGPGIPEHALETVFECFYQGPASSAQPGTGIGLHLTRSLVQLHHGTIQAENNADGQGCRFRIKLPLGSEHLSSAERENRPSARPKPQPLVPVVAPFGPSAGSTKGKATTKRRVLVVDDDAEIRRYLCRELATDYTVLESANGREALTLALSKRPDLIISDVMMPEMDGITLCRKIKQNVNINHAPVVLLTARSEEEDNLEGLGIGADAYLVKPFNLDMLKVTVQNLIQNRALLRNSFSGNQQQKDKVHKVELKSADEKLLKKFMDIMNEQLANPALSVEMIASQIGISRVHLHRKLKELTNQSTSDLMRNIRLQQAATLLASKPLNVSEVAFAVGFTNPAYFSNAFKDLYGMSPTHYRETHLDSEASAPNVTRL
ncbi:Signal transduction histidine kinase [Catalinimonas alkaloidigena]|uniref:histidine kinase n=1 Tax=Catalinimonas alkaloidigena TaxID=1075417 RepID=A0A1G9HM55_9BACT|nr:hybrid sensor histidine kinase/response regulator transcription factor [Catalinimonas alkaloidigena]SDL14009.1 Signal transduction histidine kinase [Catalinimonas alkaloidigena]